MTFARALTNPWVRQRAVRVWDLLRPRVSSVRFWALQLLGLVLAGALWIAVTGWFARGELLQVRDAGTAARTAAARGRPARRHRRGRAAAGARRPRAGPHQRSR
ncbi:hypothetical protein ACPPVO_52680 [Dactylosporangium sp. McL0621]|uniref:hypothetical protein n=1 Tax=Dactylosporangium sp. McL0621 TaxID=3415678 RepID=UPI003CF843D5